MPRRLGRFQKAFVGWLNANLSRALVPLCLKMVTPGNVVIRFMNLPACLQIIGSSSNLGVWVQWQGTNWDALLDLDVLPVKTRHGLTCALCEGQHRHWPSLEALWADHLFEPFLAWVNNDLAKAEALLLFGSADTITMAKLSHRDQIRDKDVASAEIPLRLKVNT